MEEVNPWFAKWTKEFEASQSKKRMMVIDYNDIRPYGQPIRKEKKMAKHFVLNLKEGKTLIVKNTSGPVFSADFVRFSDEQTGELIIAEHSDNVLRITPQPVPVEESLSFEIK